jgi:PAS domain S-box-containing protein
MIWAMSSQRSIVDQLGLNEAELMRTLLESTVDGVYAVDDGGRVVFANPAAVSILGYGSDQELVGRDSHATIHYRHPDGSTFAESECPLLRPRVTGEAVRVEQDWFIRRDGSFVPVSYSSAAVRAAERSGAVVVFRDITDRHLAEAERRRALEIHASRARIVQATLEERRRLGRDLHDGAQQRLINVIFALQSAAVSATDERARQAIAEALEETQQAVGELRDLAAGLDPSVLAHRGLRAAIRSLTARTPVPVSLDVPGDRFSPLIESTAYFVAAEALANVAKHAFASEANVTVKFDSRFLSITVSDDGRGGAAADQAGGSGLAGLADRVAAIGGTLVVESPPGKGTRVRATLPLIGSDASSPAAA